MTRKTAEIDARMNAVLAQSLVGIKKLQWSGEGNRFEVDVSIEEKQGYLPILFVEGYRGSGLVKLNGHPYYSLDGYHNYVPLKPGQHHLDVTFSAYRAFGERVDVAPGVPYIVYVHEGGLKLFLYLQAALELANFTQDNELKEDLLNAMGNALKEAYFEGFSPEQAGLASAIIHRDFQIGAFPQSEAWKLGFRESKDLSRFAIALDRLRADLKVLRGKYGKRGEIDAVAHAHIDTAWLWPFDETRRKVARTLSTILTLMDSFDFVYVQSMALYYQWIEEDYPELMERIRQAVKQGRWAPAAGWVESDANLISGESFARQFLYSQRFYLKEFGRLADVFWLPDTFGFCGSIPQIAKLGGVQLFATHKVFWNDTNKFPYTSFNWVGIEGTSIPAMAFGGGRGGYNSTFDVREILEQWATHSDKSKPLLYSYGYGDGGGGPTPEMLMKSSAISELPVLPEVKRDFPPIEPAKDSWRGELYLETHRGTYTSHSMMKYLNAKAEVALREAELWSALAGKKSSLEGLWRIVMKDQFHDVLPGSAISEVYQVAYAELREVIEKAESLADEARRQLAGSGQTALAFNSLPWERVEYLELATQEGEAGQKLKTGKTLLFVKVPPLGYAPVKPVDVGDKVSVSETETAILLENKYLRIEVSKEDGTVKAYDRVKKREAFNGNRFRFYENMPGWADAWDIEPSYEMTSFAPKLLTIEVGEKGPYAASVELKYAFRNSSVSERIWLHAGTRKVEVDVTPSMGDRELLLKVWFDAAVNAEKATCEIPFGNVERPTFGNNSWQKAMFEVPFLRWVDVSEADYGVALIAQAKHGISFHGSSMGLSLSKTPMYPDPTTDAEEVEAKIAIFPHEGDWRDSNVPRAAYEFCNPVSVTHGSEGEKSFMRVDDPALMLEAVKPAEDGKGLILRLYDAFNRRGEAEVEIGMDGYSSAKSLDILELNEVKREIEFDGKRLRFGHGNYEIITIELS